MFNAVFCFICMWIDFRLQLRTWNKGLDYFMTLYTVYVHEINVHETCFKILTQLLSEQ